METKNSHNDVDAYIAGFPKDIQKLLEKIRETIRKAAPEAEEVMGYGIPTFKLKGNLVHFGGYKNHIGFYPAPSGITAFEKELSVYKGAKGSIKFPLDQPIPYDLVSKIVKFRIKENLEKSELKSLIKKPKDAFPGFLSSPARRALESKGIKTLQHLSQYRQAEIMALHGMGSGSLPKLLHAMEQSGLSFKD